MLFQSIILLESTRRTICFYGAGFYILFAESAIQGGWKELNDILMDIRPDEV